MMIEIKGVQFVNKGAELMLHAVLQKIRLQLPGADIVLAPGPNSPYKARASLAAYQKLPLSKGRVDLSLLSFFLPLRVRNWLKSRFGLVTEADIDIVLDASGFAYGDQWPSALTLQLCREIKRANKNGKKYILLPQALGPFTRSADIASLKAALPLATLICAREQTSYDYIKAIMGDAPNLVKYADFTNLVKADLSAKYESLNHFALVIPNSNMVGSHNKQPLWQQNYIQVLQNAIQSISNLGIKPVILNHEGAADELICQKLKNDSAITVINESDPLVVKAIIAKAEAVVCSRFHGCVSALSQGVPCLGTSWSHKYEQLFDEYVAAEFILTPEMTPAQLELMLVNAIKDRQNPEREIRRRALISSSEQMWQQIMSIINNAS